MFHTYLKTGLGECSIQCREVEVEEAMQQYEDDKMMGWFQRPLGGYEDRNLAFAGQNLDIFSGYPRRWLRLSMYYQFLNWSGDFVHFLLFYTH